MTPGRVGPGLIARRTRALVTKDVGAEIVVYDLETDKVHLLDARASAVWRAAGADADHVDAVLDRADGHLRDAVATRDDLLVIVDELTSQSLLEADERAPRFDRRRMLKIAGAAALAAPAITTILAPPAAATHSAGNGGTPWADGSGTCTGGTAHHCASGVCPDGICGPCKSLKASACGAGANRCCSGQTCTTLTGGSYCCTNTGFNGTGGGSGTCCSGVESGGLCACTPAGSVPNVAESGLCCTPASTTLKAGTGACCIGTTEKHPPSVATAAATECCSSALATIVIAASATGAANGANPSTTPTSVTTGVLSTAPAVGDLLVVGWAATSSVASNPTFSTLTSSTGTLSVTPQTSVVRFTTSPGLAGGIVTAVVTSAMSASSTLTLTIGGTAGPSGSGSALLAVARHVTGGRASTAVAPVIASGNTGTTAAVTITPAAIGERIIVFAARDSTGGGAAAAPTTPADATWVNDLTVASSSSSKIAMIGETKDALAASATTYTATGITSGHDWLAMAITVRRNCS